LAKNRNGKEILVPKSNHALEQMKYEIASELSIPNYNQIDKGSLPARVNGSIGGEMVKRMITFAQENMANNS
jgi:hypothetical protein